MLPQGILGIDGFHLLTPLVAIVCALFIVLYLRRDGVVAQSVLWLLIANVVVALMGAKLFSLFVRDWQLYQPLSAELRSGWRYPGALAAIVVLAPLCKRWLPAGLSLSRYVDVLAIALCFGFALFRVSCFMNGCCTGGMCNAGYCISYPPSSAVWYGHVSAGLLVDGSQHSHPVLPLHLLFMGASFLVGLFLLWFDQRRRYNGQIALLYLLLHEGAKGLLESLREPYIVQLQVSSLLAALLALVLLLYFNSRAVPVTISSCRDEK